MGIISQMQHIKDLGIDFDPRLANRYMRGIKEAVSAAVWEGICPELYISGL